LNKIDATVLLVDDDAAVREAVARLLRSAGWKTEQFASAQAFLERKHFDDVGCLVLDISMPGMSGLELQAMMRVLGISMPVIFLSAVCDVPTSVGAMRDGAFDVLQKPADADTLLKDVDDAVRRHRSALARERSDAQIAGRLALLSRREREVMDRVIQGRLNKQIAAELQIAEKTVKVHRARVMAKMQTRSVAELVHALDSLDPAYAPLPAARAADSASA
jgi:FixJ family two-component response regulator